MSKSVLRNNNFLNFKMVMLKLKGLPILILCELYLHNFEGNIQLPSEAKVQNC